MTAVRWWKPVRTMRVLVAFHAGRGGRAGGPVHSREGLAEGAEAIPAFAAASGGTFDDLGVLVGQPA